MLGGLAECCVGPRDRGLLLGMIGEAPELVEPAGPPGLGVGFALGLSGWVVPKSSLRPNPAPPLYGTVLIADPVDPPDGAEAPGPARRALGPSLPAPAMPEERQGGKPIGGRLGVRRSGLARMDRS